MRAGRQPAETTPQPAGKGRGKPNIKQEVFIHDNSRIRKKRRLPDRRKADPTPRMGIHSRRVHRRNEAQRLQALFRRLRQRIDKLKQEKAQPTAEQEIKGVRIVENTEIMRIQIFFPDKSDGDTRALLKSNGFRWAPSCGA